MSLNITIATRESRLALWQAKHVKALLERGGHAVTLLGMTTRGDQILDRTLSKVGGKGLFVKELETALEEGLIIIFCNHYLSFNCWLIVFVCNISFYTLCKNECCGNKT